MKVSVIIAAYNAERTICLCLEACLAQTTPAHEIIVVDDGSTDDTRAIVEQMIDPPDPSDRSDPTDPSDRADPIRYLHQPNAGPAAARNHGARVATGDVLAFTDSDCVPAPDWLEHVIAGFIDDNVAGVGGTYAIANPESYLARMIHEEIVMRHERMGPEVDFLGSFNVAYRKDIFDTVGGFDETFRAASGEDNDLAYRIADTGGRLRFTRDAVVAHYHPTRLWRYLRTQYGHGYWRMKLYTKHTGRARGDRYAGLADLLAPPVSFAAVAWSLLVVPSAHRSPLESVAELCAAAAILVYLALQGWKGVPMARRVGWSAIVAFPTLLFLRDLARALGLVHGLWDFAVRQKGIS